MKNFKFIKRLISCVLSFVILFTFSTSEYSRAANEPSMQKAVQITIENDDNDIKAVKMYNPQNNSEYFLSVEKIPPQLNKAENNSCIIKLLVKNDNEKIIDEEFTGIILEEFTSQDLKQQLSKLSGSRGASQQEFVDFLNAHINFEENTEPTYINNPESLSFTFTVGGLFLYQITAAYLIVVAATIVSIIAIILIQDYLKNILTSWRRDVAVNKRLRLNFGELGSSVTFPEENLDGIIINDTSAVKHMESSLVKEVLEEMKNRRADVEVYARTKDALDSINRRAVMMVIDINTKMTGKVNRHMGNKLISGESMGEGQSIFPDFPSEILDLNGYTVFIIYNPSERILFHAHFVPQYMRPEELHYQRYKGEFDLQLYPRVIEDKRYNKYNLQTPKEKYEFECQKAKARDGREEGLDQDSKGFNSIVPKN
ncbi:hypothetical protein [Vallitalea guaymasensis]|uniref:hypothetical protein n=1 Tax=Vallitalea guaymasensis TaxID=1185412 RepID=UPI00272D60AE|nr:hypothetical protein [Vallitalea guaymasensis]